MNRTPFRTACVAAIALCSGSALPAQGRFPPDSFTNLKFFPKTIESRTLIATMRGFTTALGVRCSYCHVGEEGQPLSAYNFASDDKRPKRVARVMLDMVHHINEEHLGEVPDRPTPRLEVRCETCHRGLARPRLLPDTLSSVIAVAGVDSAARTYRALRQRFYGSGTFDFSERVLNQFARDLPPAQADNALGLLRLNAEFYPGSGLIHFLMGEAYRSKNDTANALLSYQKALALDSTIGQARQRLGQLRRP